MGWRVSNSLKGIAVFLLFVTLSLVGLFQLFNSWQLYSKGSLTSGLVVNVKNATYGKSSRGNRNVHYEFTDENGKVRVAMDRRSFSIFENVSYVNGEEVKLYYISGEKLISKIYTFYSFWLQPLFIALIGIFLSLLTFPKNKK